MIIINLEKAKEIKKQNLRLEREPLLSQLDIAFQKALESNLDTSDIISEKQRLRDITLLVDDCNNIDELNSVTL